jgi:hypothetical protein
MLAPIVQALEFKNVMEEMIELVKKSDGGSEEVPTTAPLYWRDFDRQGFDEIAALYV